MVHFADMTNEDRLIRLENRATEIRKILLGALLFAKDIWKDGLEQKQEGIEILKALEGAEKVFIKTSLTDRFERLENILDVIHKRSEALFVLMEYFTKNAASKTLFFSKRKRKKSREG